jgi:hypothetical protein
LVHSSPRFRINSRCEQAQQGTQAFDTFARFVDASRALAFRQIRVRAIELLCADAREALRDTFPELEPVRHSRNRLALAWRSGSRHHIASRRKKVRTPARSCLEGNDSETGGILA